MTDVPSDEELAAMLPGIDVDVEGVAEEVESWKALADLLRLLPHPPRVRVSMMAHPGYEDRYTNRHMARMVMVGCHALTELLMEDDGKFEDTIENDRRPCAVEGVMAVTNALNWLFRHTDADYEYHLRMADEHGYGIPNPQEGNPE